jgi:hypothetical protein
MWDDRRHNNKSSLLLDLLWMMERYPYKEIEPVPEPQPYITPLFSWAAKDPRFISYRIESTNTIQDSLCEIIDIRV